MCSVLYMCAYVFLCMKFTCKQNRQENGNIIKERNQLRFYKCAQYIWVPGSFLSEYIYTHLLNRYENKLWRWQCANTYQHTLLFANLTHVHILLINNTNPSVNLPYKNLFRLFLICEFCLCFFFQIQIPDFPSLLNY